MRSRNGFTLMELLIVLIIAGIVGGVALVNVSRSMRNTRVQRAASVIATDLRLAHSMAARQRRPVEIAIDTVGRIIRVRDAVTPTTVYSQRNFSLQSDLPVESMGASHTTMRVFPNGVAAAGPMTVTVRWSGRTRTVTMTRAGMVRVSGT
jgi:type II secretion system protein H